MTRAPQLSTLALLLLGCGAKASEPPALAAEAPSARTRWQAVTPAAESAWLEAPARVLESPEHIAVVGVPLSARVLRVRVHVGQEVRAGEPLVDVLMPELIRAAGAMRSAELRIDGWQKRRERVQGLFDKGLARADELSDIDTNIASVRGERESARATLRAAGEPDARAGALLEGTGAVSLKAPISGRVVSLVAHMGQSLDPASAPLVELVGNDGDRRIEARFSVPPPEGASFAWVEPARSVPLVFEALSPHANERDGSRTGWLHADDDSPLVAGALGKVRLIPAAGWVVVPARSLGHEHGRPVVRMRTDAGAQDIEVALIQSNASEALVAGLPQGAQIAAEYGHPSGLDQ